MKVSKKEKSYFKKTTFLEWLIIIFIVGLLFLFKIDIFNLSFLSVFIEDYKILAAIIYILVLALTGLVLTPSTPFTLAGLLFFSPIETFFYNLIGIVFSLTIAYYFTQYLGLDHAVEKRYPKQVKKLKQKLNKKELIIIILWSFTPFVPKDLIIYTSSSLRIPYKKCLIGVLIGEGLLNAIYIFSLASIFALF